MVYSLHDYFSLIKPQLPDSIIKKNNLLLLEQVTKQLPIVSMFLLESRLSDSCDRIDLSIGLQQQKLSKDQILIDSPFWQKLCFFSELWTTSGTIVHQIVEDIWLEIDLDQDIHNLQIPCYFLTLKTEVLKKQNNIDQKVAQILKIISLLNDHNALHESKIHLFKHCLENLPDSSSITQIGVMLSRGQDKIRINIEKLHGQEIANYLSKIINTPVDQELQKVISIFTPLSDRIILTFDLENETIGKRIGLECFLNQQPKKEPRWHEFLDILVKKNCCTPEKKEFLLNWTGLTQKKDIQTPWPKNLKQLEPWMEKDIISVFFRTINHLKLVYQPPLNLEAKAYLGFGHSWFNSRQGFRV